MARFGAPLFADFTLAHAVMTTIENRNDASTGRPPEERLDSWKAIATYLGRGVRTVQRWEREEGLPVHRLAHAKRGSVFADRTEVDAWWESRRISLSNDASADSEAAPSSGPERLTWTSTAIYWPAMSSDGRLLAYLSDGGQEGMWPQIWLHQVGGSAVPLTSTPVDRSHLSFAAGDTRLVFTAADDSGHGVYTMPTLGGEPRLLKRAATAGRPSPDGKWLAYVSLEESSGVRLSSFDDRPERTVAPTLMDIAFIVWSPDSRHILVQAHEDPTMELDYWIVAIDDSAVSNTGILHRLRVRGQFPITLPAAWSGDSLVFSVITLAGVGLWRQRLTPGTLEPAGEAERITNSAELDRFPTAGPGCVAYVSTNPDHNLWSAAIDPATGMVREGLRRMTRRAPGIVMHLSVSRTGETLSYFRARYGSSDMMLRNLETGSEFSFMPEPPLEYGFQTLSPSGTQLAFGARMPGPRASRPLFVATVAEGKARKLADDCDGRPRQWIDERLLLVETFGSRFHSIFVMDAESGDRWDLLSESGHSIGNPRVSPDGGWVAFDATQPGRKPRVFVAALNARAEAVPFDAWTEVDRAASHPFWSADGALLYYLPTIPSSDFRNVVRARRFDVSSGAFVGEAFTAFMSSEMVVPAQMMGTTPVATHDRIIFMLGDFRGDVWRIRT